MFPSSLNQFNLLFEDPRVRFTKERVGSEEFIIPCYLFAETELWSIPNALETRGNVYSTEKGGSCVYASFPKFFNVNERPETQQNLIKDQIVLVTEKKDGSIVGVVFTEEGFKCKSKKSFYSDLALEANSNLTTNIELLSNHLLVDGFTPIFEYTSPTRRIVIDYGSIPTFTLLGVRSIYTGEFLSYLELKELSKQYDIPLVETFQKTWDELLWDVENLKDIEGYVLLLSSGSLVKIKTKDYLTKHYFFTQLTERDCAELVVDEKMDDLKSTIKDIPDIDLSFFTRLEHRVFSDLVSLKQEVEQIISLDQELSVKEFAIKYKPHPLFSLLMSEKNGKEPLYKKYWKKWFLPTYSNRVVLNVNFENRK